MECEAVDRFCVRALSSFRDLRLDDSSLLHQGPPRALLQVLRVADRHVAMVGDLRTRPVRDTIVLDAEIVDAKGMRHIFEFPRLADLPWWQKIPRYRQPKFTGNMTAPEYFGSAKVLRPAMPCGRWI